VEQNVLQTVAHLRILFSLCPMIVKSPVIPTRDSNPEILPNWLAVASIVPIDYKPNPWIFHRAILCQYVTEDVMDVLGSPAPAAWRRQEVLLRHRPSRTIGLFGQALGRDLPMVFYSISTTTLPRDLPDPTTWCASSVV
jgi:hypothetical protein